LGAIGVLSAVRGGAAAVLRTDEEPTDLISLEGLAAQAEAILSANAIGRLLGDLSPWPPY
jgi:hypothetical protein